MMPRATRERLVAGDAGLSGTSSRVRGSAFFYLSALGCPRALFRFRGTRDAVDDKNDDDDRRRSNWHREKTARGSCHTAHRPTTVCLARAMLDGRRRRERGESEVGWRGQRERERWKRFNALCRRERARFARAVQRAPRRPTRA